jgi:hypothetical protein
LSGATPRELMEQIVRFKKGSVFVAPGFCHFPDLAGGHTKPPAERADEGGGAAELKIGGQIDQVLALPRR